MLLKHTYEVIKEDAREFNFTSDSARGALLRFTTNLLIIPCVLRKILRAFLSQSEAAKCTGRVTFVIGFSSCSHRENHCRYPSWVAVNCVTHFFLFTPLYKCYIMLLCVEVRETDSFPFRRFYDRERKNSVLTRDIRCKFKE